MDESTAVVTAEYREIEVADRRGSIAPLPFDFRPLPIPDGVTIDLTKLADRTPQKYRKRHPKGFMYIPSDFPPVRLNEVFGPGGWTFRVMYVRDGRGGQPFFNNQSKKYVEKVVEGYLLAPGIWPTYGIGSAMFSQDDFGDPRFMEATAQKAATSLALKDAAKKLGIGADINEDVETRSEVEGARRTAVTLFAGIAADKKAKATAAIKKLAPNAFDKDGNLVAEMIDDDVAEEVMQKVLEFS